MMPVSLSPRSITSRQISNDNSATSDVTQISPVSPSAVASPVSIPIEADLSRTNCATRMASVTANDQLITNVTSTIGSIALDSPQRSASTPNVPKHTINASSVQDVNGSDQSRNIDGLRESPSNSGNRNDPQQRTRRSSRNLDDSSRRRSRNSRTPTSQGPQTAGRSSGAPSIRPTLDLPVGYGKKVYLSIPNLAFHQTFL